MGILCLGTYLRILLNAKNKTSKQREFVKNILSLLEEPYDDSDAAFSKLVLGTNNPTKGITAAAISIGESDYERLVTGYKNTVLPMINPNELSNAIKIISIIISEDETIDSETVVDLISSTKKCELSDKVKDQVTFLAGVFIYVIRSTDNRHETGFVKKTVDYYSGTASDYKFVSNAKSPECDTLDISNEYEEKSEQEANSFCIKFDAESKLIPLCQIVNITNPAKKHCREMFDVFCTSTKSTQAKILKIKEIPPINVNGNDWWIKNIEQFKQDYVNYELGDKRYLHLFDQYFERLLGYGTETVTQYFDYVFPATIVNPMINFNRKHRLNILGLIDEYIYYKNVDEYKSKLKPPMDMLWDELNLGYCDEIKLVAVLASVILGVCFAIPKINQFPESIPTTFDIKTAEDLFYYVLYTLYYCYSNESEK